MTSVVDETLEPQPSRYVVGMDLGTTNSAVAYVDTTEQPWRVRVLDVPQLVAAGQIEPRETLPSFHYQPTADERSSGAFRLPWGESAPSYAVGIHARDLGTLTPGRLISSAKSWLCHSAVDRRADILPWHPAEDVERLSPVEVSACYLRHVREAWNARFPDEPLERQDFVLTLPASFDEVARELTVEAAAQAGLPRVVLIEEPQAAFYAWINLHSENWEQLVSPGQKILVCDVGGGTSDFTLIRVRRGEGGKVQFHRVAVGEHLILGGDNLDLALAHHLEQRLGGCDALTPRQWDVLVRSCRRVKEELLGQRAVERFTVNLPGSGTRLIGGGLQLEVTRDEVHAILVDGFFPRVPLDARPTHRRSGFQEFGLPYAADPAITRHLAAFLTAHRHDGSWDHGPGVTTDETDRTDAGVGGTGVASAADLARPDIVLFNGGVFESATIQARVVQVLEDWFRSATEPNWSPVVLANDRLDLAVARGAAYYGMVRRGEGVRITANLARSYYIGVGGASRDVAPQDDSLPKDSAASTVAVCLLPGNAEPGQDFHLSERKFELLVSQPAEFPLYVSSTRLADRPGELLAVDLERMRALPPLRTALRTRRRSDSDHATVELHARLTEIGTLDLWCAEVQGERNWRLQFDVRSATQTDVEAHESAGEQLGIVDEESWAAVREVLVATFGTPANAGTSGAAPDSLMKNLVAAGGLKREEWPPSLLRRIGEMLLENEAGRRKSPLHEARWLNLLGYALRPGFGMAVDDWRVAETWRLVQGRLAHGAATSRTESLILWRRIAGGLTAGQQRAIAEPLLSPVRSLHRRTTTGKDRGTDLSFSPHEATEVWRLLGSLELLPLTLKSELGRMLVDLLPAKKLATLRPALAWALGRVGAREPAYGPLNTVVSTDVARRWLVALMAVQPVDPAVVLSVVLLARRTGDRYRDMPTDVRRDVLKWLADNEAPTHFRVLVEEGGRLDAEEQGRVFGESLPIGLRL